MKLRNRIDLTFLLHRMAFLSAKVLRSPLPLKYFPYEPKVLRIMRSLKGRLFVDVGAYIGFYALGLHKNFERVVAVEAHPETMNALKRNARSLGVTNLRFVQKAVYNRDGLTLPLHRGKCPTWHTLDGSLQNFRYNGNRNVLVETVTLTSLLENYETVDLVKLDVEGAEFRVLEGASPVLGKVQQWLIELEDARRARELERFMLRNHYYYRWITSKHLYAKR
ncbi:MAG: FkbM family methyltransferase [Desulfobacterales bacterium]|nr:FkbM family methyltransferase [Desulfobacterales bacterium]